MSAGPAPYGSGVPPWMAESGIEPGDWGSLTKNQLRAMMRPCNELDQQVYAALLFLVISYRSEIASVQRRQGKLEAKIEPATPGNIADILHEVALKYYRGAGITLSSTQTQDIKETKDDMRRSLDRLEEAGLIERRNDKGIPLHELRLDQLQRLPSGSTRIVVFLEPRPARPARVKREWKNRIADDGEDQAKKVVMGCLPPAQILMILKRWNCNNWPKSLLAISRFSELDKNQPLRDVIAQALEAAKLSFQQVVMGCLPEGVTPGLPQVVTPDPPVEPAIRSERKVERKVERVSQSEVEGELGPTDPLLKMLRTELPGLEPPSSGLMAKIYVALEDAPVEQLGLRIRQRRKSITSMGMVEKLAGDVLSTWRATAAHRAAQERAYEAGQARNHDQATETARRTLSDPRSTDEDRALAREILVGLNHRYH